MKRIGINSFIWVSKYINDSVEYTNQTPKSYKDLEIVHKEPESFTEPIRCKVIEIYETFSKDNTVVVVTAPLSGFKDFNNSTQNSTFSIECKKVNGVLVPVSEFYYIAIKKSEILRNLRKVFRKFVKELKMNHKYNKMRTVIQHLITVEKRHTITRMVEKHPENFI